MDQVFEMSSSEKILVNHFACLSNSKIEAELQTSRYSILSMTDITTEKIFYDSVNSSMQLLSKRHFNTMNRVDSSIVGLNPNCDNIKSQCDYCCTKSTSSKRKHYDTFKSAYCHLMAENPSKFISHNRPRQVGLSRPSISSKSHSNESEKQTKPLQNAYNSLDKNLVAIIEKEILLPTVNIGWRDIAGLDYVKKMVQEVAIWPILRPDIFSGLRGPPKGILLFGPPGTGKTLIGRCIASQSNSTFFATSAGALTSKWIGEGEKLVRALFAVAKEKQPSVIFLDEIDSLLTRRNADEHESSRRLKTEFLVQLDGASSSDSNDRILVVGATNRPQELDEAVRRRFSKRLYVPLPDCSSRCTLIRNLSNTSKCFLTDAEINLLGEATDGYSGADITSLCKEAALGPIRSIQNNICEIELSQVRDISYNDFLSALSIVKSTVSQSDLIAYIEWNKLYGSGT